MNNEEAKFILQGYRPDGADAGDGTFAAALDQVRLDPALGGWFAGQQAFDAAVSAKLNSILPPAGLREAILAGGRVTAPDRAQARWWRSPVWLAAGMAVLLSVGLALWPRQAVAGTTLADYVLADTAQAGLHGGHGEQTDELQAMLGDSTTRLAAGLPVDFVALRKSGCRTIGFQGHELLEVCFQRNGAWFHCYIARRADFPQIAVALAFRERDGLSVASWSDTEHVYLVAGKAGRAALQQLL